MVLRWGGSPLYSVVDLQLLISILSQTCHPTLAFTVKLSFLLNHLVHISGLLALMSSSPLFLSILLIVPVRASSGSVPFCSRGRLGPLMAR